MIVVRARNDLQEDDQNVPTMLRAMRFRFFLSLTSFGAYHQHLREHNFSVGHDPHASAKPVTLNGGHIVHCTPLRQMMAPLFRL